MVTGINLIDNSGNPNGIFGNPNVFKNNQFIVYPIPAKNVISINTSKDISKIWITSATAEKIYQETEFINVLNSDLYKENQIASIAKLEFFDISNNLSINLETLKPGYYRVFVKIKEKIFWENIYIPDGNEGFGLESLRDFWN